MIDWKTIDLKGRESGSLKVKCPKCIDSRTDKSDKSLSVNIDKGVAKCHYCEDISIREGNTTQAERKFVRPAQNWVNYTNLSDKIIKWFEARKINQYVLKDMRLTEESFWQPKRNDSVNNIVFNYFEGDIVVNKKYRDSLKNFTQSKDGKPIMYNINSAPFSEELYIVEGEIDALSLIQIGIKNVVSIPNGANDNDQYWINSEAYIKDVKKFLIGTDNDDKGNAIADKIAQRLGRFKCERINWSGKDANEDLVNGVLEESIHNRSSYPVSGTFTASNLSDKMTELYDNGLPPTIKIKNPTFARMNDIFQIMFGQLTVCTGIPSHGKSNFTDWYILNLLVENDYKASFFSPEHLPMALHQSSFAQKIVGKNYFYDVEGTPRMNKQELADYIKWSDQKLYLTSPDAGDFATWNWVLEKFTEQIYSYGINFFIIDAFNKVEFDDIADEKQNINKVLSRLTSFCQSHNVAIILVAHPTKLQGENGVSRMPGLYDVSGSAGFRNQTHNGFVIHRVFDETDDWTVFKNLKTKYAFQGTIGAEVEFRYHKPSGRLHDKLLSPQTHNLLVEQPKILMEFKNVIEPNSSFDKKDDSDDFFNS